jgi:hypothetical protein
MISKRVFIHFPTLHDEIQFAFIQNQIDIFKGITVPKQDIGISINAAALRAPLPYCVLETTAASYGMKKQICL